MIGVESILNRLAVLITRFDKDGGMEMNMFYILRKNEELKVDGQENISSLDGIGQNKIKNPVLLVITGYGVIRKVFAKEEEKDIERVTGNSEFIWDGHVTPSGEQVLTFTRRDRIATLLQKLESAGIPVVEIHAGQMDGGGNFSAGREADWHEWAAFFARKFYENEIKWKELSKPGDRGNILSSLVLNKIKLPLLVCLFILLAVNYLWHNLVRDNYSRQQTELNRLETNVTHQEKLSREMEQMVSDFKGKERRVFVPVLDKIASLIPEEVILETMAVNPLLKSIEEKKPLMIRDGYIGITGSTSVPEKVTLFMGKVAGMNFIREVKLISLDKNREDGLFYFKIWIR